MVQKLQKGEISNWKVLRVEGEHESQLHIDAKKKMLDENGQVT